MPSASAARQIEVAMTLQRHQQTTERAPAVLTDEQRQRVADALEDAQADNTRRNYASQFGKFRLWCEREDQSPLPVQPEVLAAYAAELADEGKSMSTVRLAVSSIVDAHRRVGLDSPVTAGVSEMLRGADEACGRGAKTSETARCRCSGRNQGDGAGAENDKGRLT